MTSRQAGRAKPGGAKQRMLDSAVTLLRERGAAGVTIDAVLAHSGAPRGSVYHHFPGGRTELIVGAARQAGEFITALIDAAAAEGDPARAMDRFVGFWKQSLAATDYTAGCPVVALAVDGRHVTAEAAALTREIFTGWQTRLADLLVGHAVPAARARRLATLAVAAIEGAVILCRAHRDTGPLDDIAAEIPHLLGTP
ncbi:MAG: TetR/AcrR family transcriptional regulator [Sciscionella sp.]